MRYLPVVLSIWLLISCEEQASEKGDELYQQGNYEEAIRAYSEYLSINPTDIKSLYNRGRAYEEIELYELSFKDFESVLEEDPQNLQANLSVGSYHYRKQDYENAKYHFDIAVQAHEESAQAHFLRARAYHKVGEKDVAMDGYNRAISLDGSLGDAYLYRGALKTFLKQNRSACEDYQKAKALNVEKAIAAIESFCR